jgi:CheY-like chemotaxis protein
MAGSGLYSDRRRSFRVNVYGLALLWHEDRIAGRYSLADLSIGGCLLRDGPPCDIGEDYGLVLDLEGDGGLRLPAKVVRQRATGLGGRELGLEFLEHAPALEDRIQDLVIQILERDQPASRGRVLVVDMDPLRRTEAAESLRRLGHEVLEAATPLEAVWEFENGPMDIHTVFVARSLGGSDGRDLLKFIGSRYAGVWRVLVAEQAEPQGAADAVLLGPCHLSRLRKVLPKPTTAHWHRASSA